MAQDYVIKDIRKGKVWSNVHGSYQGFSAALEGIGEPVSINKKMPVKHEPMVGETIYGQLEEKEINGRVYYQFKSEKKPDQFNKRDDSAIRAQWAIGQAMTYQQSAGAVYSPDDVESLAKELFQMVERVKSGN